MRKVLVYGYLGLGNFILLTPTLRALRLLFPKARFTLLYDGKTGIRGIAESERLFEDYIIHPRNGGLVKILGTARKIRSKRYNLLVGNFNASRRFLAALTVLSGAKLRAGHVSGPGWANPFDFVYNVKVGIRENQHEVDMNLEIAYALGLKSRQVDRVPHLSLSDGLRRFGKKKIESLMNGQPFKRVVCMQVGSSPGQSWKRWNVEKYAELCGHLMHDRDLVILMGSRDERELSLAVADQLSIRPHVITGDTTFLESGAILAESDLLICNDSGLMHLAAAVGTPVVAIYGPTDYTRTFPIGKMHRIIRRDLECSPCFKLDGDQAVKNCPYDYRCFGMISVSDVLQACGAA